MFHRKLIVWLGLIALLASASAGLQGQAKGKDKGKAKATKEQSMEKPTQTPSSLAFLAGFTKSLGHQHAVKVGLIGQSALPPGVAKNLARGKPLPPGIAKRSLPKKYLSLLPHHEDYQWAMAGLDLVLISKADKLVREIYRDVFK